jgi:O-antigen/teichoic acid export membrane protein
MSGSRKKKTLINIITAFSSNILIYVLSLFTSKIIKQKLGLEVLGLNGFLSNVVSILNISELGIGTAITFALYKPLAENDRETIKSLMVFYKKAYRYIALAIASLGLILLPFIPHLIKDSPFSSKYIYLAYILFLTNSVISYFLIYKRTLIIADQKNYIITTFTLVYTYILRISQLVAVYYTSNFILYLIIQIISTFIYNLIISFKCDKIYPFLKEKSSTLPVELRNTVILKIKALFFHSIGTIAVFGTDNILITFFCGISDAGRYTSYLSIINMISKLISLVFENLKDSLGNFLVTETKERQHSLFQNLLYMNQSLVSICSICLLILLTPFIKLWFGEDTTLPEAVVVAMVMSFYISKSNLAIGNMKAVAGLFEQDKFVPIIESVINLGASIILSKYFGIIGIVLGTIISTLLCPFWVQPTIVYKNMFSTNVFKYFLKYAEYFIRFIIIYFFAYFLINKVIKFTPTTYTTFFIEAFLLFIGISLLWFLTTFWKKETKYFINLIYSKFNKNHTLQEK